MKRMLPLCLPLAVGLLACAEEPNVNLGGNYQIATSVPPIENRNIDILFVSDNSASMGGKQAELAAKSKAALFDVIAAAIGGPPNLHVGVITSSLGAGPYDNIAGCAVGGDGGRLQSTPLVQGCTAPNGNFLIDVEAPGGGREVNYQGTIDEALGCIVQRGDGGCGFEQHFAALELALSGTVPENQGFLRDDAILVVVFLTDEDDGSAADTSVFDPANSTLGDLAFRWFKYMVECTPDEPELPGEKLECRARAGSPYGLELQHVVDALVAAKGGDASKVVVAAIAGEASPVVVAVNDFGVPQVERSCTLPDGGGAVPAIRLRELLTYFPARAWADSICAPDMSFALSGTANVVGDVAARRGCLRGDFKDLDAVAAGVQPSCRAFATLQPFTAEESRVELRGCDLARADESCFSVVADAATCGYAEPGLRAVIEPRGGVAGDRHVIVECLVE